MNERDRRAVVVSLIDALDLRGSWCGETHIQKAVYFLQAAFGVDLEYDFILYLHGPFSFDLRAELTEMRAEDDLGLKTKYPFGPQFFVDTKGRELQTTRAGAIAEHSAAVDGVADFLGSTGVTELERLATALWVTVDQPLPEPSRDNRARAIVCLKPHVSMEAAQSAVEEVDSLLARVVA